jgi:tripartite-type tricarboxylate transporter receptor subunit TctC
VSTGLRLRAAAFALALCAAAAVAQDYPGRPVRLIVPASPGTGMDFFGRTIGQALTDVYKQQVIADNRAGAGGLIGASIVAAATPDGYTLGMASTSTIISPLLQLKPPYRPINDFTPVALLASITSVLVVAPGVQAKTVQEFIALAKARPGQFNFASIGSGTAAHLTAEIFNRAAGIDAVHVPFKIVADIYTEMLASRVHYLIFVSPASIPMLRDGKLRALAVTSAKRNAALPDTPGVVEAGLPDAEVDTLFGIIGPAALPKAIVARLHSDIVKILQRPETRERFNRQGGEPAADTTPEDYARQLRAEYERYRKLLPAIGLKPQ